MIKKVVVNLLLHSFEFDFLTTFILHFYTATKGK